MYLHLIVALFLVFWASFSMAQDIPPAEHYKNALTQAADGNHDAALAALEKAAAAGFGALNQLRAASELAALRDNPRFASIVSQVRRNLFPCEEGEHYGDFDFWVGDWDVYGSNDQIAGSNRISRVENGCALEELWTGASGVTGRSLNFYDPHKNKWRQHWVSATGLLIDIEGNLVDGSMVLVGKVFYPGTGQQADFRGSWTLLEDGRVRQFFEQHDVETDKWNPWFEGFYVRQAE